MDLIPYRIPDFQCNLQRLMSAGGGYWDQRYLVPLPQDNAEELLNRRLKSFSMGGCPVQQATLWDSWKECPPPESTPLSELEIFQNITLPAIHVTFWVSKQTQRSSA